jgi:acetolactate synthase-1/2/3 large subunit
LCGLLPLVKGESERKLMAISGARALIACLKKEGVHTVFGMPGGANLPIYDELYDSGIRHILVRHEQSAGHMADGFARAARRPGVCFATSGPGATNLVTPIATAYLDSSPVVAVTGQVQRSSIGRDGFQETDIIGVITPVTKYCHQIRSQSEFVQEIRKAFYVANSGRPGPVLIDIPKDLQTADLTVESEEEIYGKSTMTIRGYSPPSMPDPGSVATAARMLANATRPMILAGGGVTIAGAFEELQVVAELLQCPVATTFKGKGSFSEVHPLSIGPIGMHGHVEANRLILEADVLLAAGARFSDRSVGKFEEFGKEMSIIHADIDPSEIGKNKAVDHAIIGDIKEILGGIAKELMSLLKANASNDYVSKARNTVWIKRVNEVRKIAHEGDAKRNPDDLSARNVLKTLRKVLPSNTVTTTEVGQCQMWSSLFFDVIQPGTFFSSTGLGTMGFGFPAAVGAKIARPECPVVDIAGDGSFNMTENCLATCVTERIPVTAMIMNNDMLGMVAQWQRMFYNRRLIGVRMNGVPDFVRLAQAYGAQGYHVDSLSEFEKAMTQAIRSDVVSVVDVPIHPEEDVFPFVIPGTALKDMVVA